MSIPARHQNWFTRLLVGLLIFNLGLGVVIYFRPDALVHLYFFDVGQGDASLIKTANNHYILIDGGPDDSIVSRLDTVMPMWHRSLDLVILTHPHADHATGLLSVLKSYQVRQFWYTGTAYDSETYRTLLAEITRQHIPIQLANFGDEVRFGDTHLSIRWPLVEPSNLPDPNENSIVGLIDYKQFSALFTGDIYVAQEQALLPSLIPITALKAPHHGSRTSSSPEFINQLHPRLASISLGADNKFGHPHIDILNRYQQSGVPIYRTDQNGTIEIITDGIRYSTKTN